MAQSNFHFKVGAFLKKNGDFQLLTSGQMPFKRCKGANHVLSSPLIGLNSKSKNENEKLEAPWKHFDATKRRHGKCFTVQVLGLRDCLTTSFTSIWRSPHRAAFRHDASRLFCNVPLSFFKVFRNNWETIEKLSNELRGKQLRMIKTRQEAESKSDTFSCKIEMALKIIRETDE